MSIRTALRRLELLLLTDPPAALEACVDCDVSQCPRSTFESCAKRKEAEGVELARREARQPTSGHP
jgi:hypothetical protein